MLCKWHVPILMACRNLQTCRMETEGAAERQAAQDVHLGLFRLRQTTRQPRSFGHSTPDGLPGPGVAIKNLSGLQRGFQVGLFVASLSVPRKGSIFARDAACQAFNEKLIRARDVACCLPFPSMSPIADGSRVHTWYSRIDNAITARHKGDCRRIDVANSSRAQRCYYGGP